MLIASYHVYELMAPRYFHSIVVRNIFMYSFDDNRDKPDISIQLIDVSYPVFPYVADFYNLLESATLFLYVFKIVNHSYISDALNRRLLLFL